MVERTERTRAYQIGLLALLSVCFAQVLWWVLDEADYTHRVVSRLHDFRVEQFAAGAGEGNRVSGQAAGGAAVAADLAALEDELNVERRSRLRRFGWEGGFFLVVLVVGMGVLARALRQEAQFRRRQENFLAAVSHEFKSPLASMRLSAESLSLRDPPAERRAQLVGRMLDDLGRVEAMVVNILDATRVGRVHVELAAERLHVREMVRAALDELDERFRVEGVDLQIELPEGLVVRADPRAVRSVLSNLLDNALKAVAGVERPQVSVRARPDANTVVVAVTDNGVGFEPAESKRLFRKFYRPGNELRRTSHGSGLGLYLVRRWVELGGGEARASSEGPGRGACFEVSWPRAEEAA